MKQCKDCHQVKPIEDFYRTSKNGRDGACKPCRCIRVQIHREKNIERIREYDRSRANQPHRIAQRILVNKRQTRQQKNARQIAERNTGALPCIICKYPKTERHHPDYSRPLHVIYLCVPHHRQLHAGRFSLIPTLTHE